MQNESSAVTVIGSGRKPICAGSKDVRSDIVYTDFSIEEKTSINPIDDSVSEVSNKETKANVI